MKKKQYPSKYFVGREVIEKANLFGLTSIENYDLTLKGLIAKMKEWDKEHNGVEAYIYDMTKRNIEDDGGQMPRHIKRVK